MRVDPCRHYEPFMHLGSVVFAMRVDGALTLWQVPSQCFGDQLHQGSPLATFQDCRNQIEEAVRRYCLTLDAPPSKRTMIPPYLLEHITSA